MIIDAHNHVDWFGYTPEKLIENMNRHHLRGVAGLDHLCGRPNLYHPDLFGEMENPHGRNVCADPRQSLWPGICGGNLFAAFGNDPDLYPEFGDSQEREKYMR
jgi:hypothetical protein